MASYFDKPKDYDDGAFIAVRFNDILPLNHPARYIKNFIENIDVSNFINKYEVGAGKKGRAPKDVKMMLGIILYALYSRIFSAHKIDYATYSYADFWIFTHQQRISHDKISDFINKHEEDIKDVFLETIKLADKNNLLSFDALYQDGFFLKANASKHKNRNMARLKNKEKKLSIMLDELFKKLKSSEEDINTKNEIIETQNELNKIKSLKDELNKKIKKRTKNKAHYKVKEIEKKITINETDQDSELMMMKNGGYDNAYLKICSLDEKADIVVGSSIENHYNESGNSVDLFNKANKNCNGLGEYKKCVTDSGFNSMKNCETYDSMGVDFISPTKLFENERRNPETNKNKIKFEYRGDIDCFICSEGAILQNGEEYYDSRKDEMVKRYWNKDACKNCKRLKDCTNSKEGFRKVKRNTRSEVQNKMLDIFKSEAGQKYYSKRHHVAETFQGDLKKNGKFIQLSRIGINKAKIDSTLHDIVWNLRRIFNATDGKVIIEG